METSFNFGKALEYMKQGHKVTRKSFGRSDVYLFIMNAPEYKPNTTYIIMKQDRDVLGPWEPNQADILAEDWIVLEK